MREGERENENGREKESEKETGKQRTNRETHVESGTNQKDARRKKKAINQTKHNHKKFQKLALTTFFLWRESPLLEKLMHFHM